MQINLSIIQLLSYGFTHVQAVWTDASSNSARENWDIFLIFGGIRDMPNPFFHILECSKPFGWSATISLTFVSFYTHVAYTFALLENLTRDYTIFSNGKSCRSTASVLYFQ